MGGFDVQYFSEFIIVSAYTKKVKSVFNQLWIGQTKSVGISEYSGLNILSEIDQV